MWQMVVISIGSHVIDSFGKRIELVIDSGKALFGLVDRVAHGERSVGKFG